MPMATERNALGRLRADFANNDPADPDDDAVTEYRYDRASRLLAEIQNGRAVQSQYDPAGNRTSVKYPGGRTLSYHYDRLNRLEEIKDNGTFLAGWSYSARGLVEEKRLGNGARTTYEHDARGWTTGKEATSFHARITSFEHTYDNEGNKLTATDKVLPELSKKYAYDKIYRLTDWKRRGRPGGRLRERQSWDLDLLGNWLETAHDSTTEKRKHNEVNELTGIKKNDSERTLTYNPAGNLTDDDNQIYIYNYRNLLTEIRDKSSGDTVVEYTYDASSRRRTKKIPGPGNSPPSTVVFIYDGWKVLEERDGDGNVLSEYTHGLYIDEYVTIETGGKRAYYHQDTIYNVKALTDEKGKVIERYAYTAYGEPSVLNKNGMPVPRSKVGNRYLFQGRRLDEESALYYFRHRMMNSDLGRFLQRDPVRRGGANGYSFVNNGPLNSVDPQGRDKVERNGRIIYWITHKRGTKRSSQFTIGVVSEDERWVEVDQLFGGGCVRIEELKQIAGARLRLTGLRCDNRMCEYRKVTQLVELARQEVAEAKLSTRDAWLVGFYRGQQKGILRILPHAEGAVTIQHLEFSYRFDTRRGLIEGEWLHADYALDPLTLYGGSVTVGVGESGTITPYVAAPIPGHSRHGPVTFSYPLRRGKPVGADVSFGRGIGSPIGVKWSPRFKKLGAEHDELW